MLKPVIILVSDQTYLPHCRSLFANCASQGKWTGDYAIILPPGLPEKADFERRGIFVLEDPEPRHYRKFAVFDDEFAKRFDVCLYIDADVLVSKPLAPLIDEIEWGTVLADREPFDLMHMFTYWAEPEKLKTEPVLNVFRWLWSRYDPTYFQFNTSIMGWHPRTLPANLRQDLLDIRKRIEPAHCHIINGSDQSVANLALYGRFRPVRSRLFSYWEMEGPETIMVHCCSGLAPWLKKPQTSDAAWAPKLGRLMYDVYHENLAAFEEMFPVRK